MLRGFMLLSLFYNPSKKDDNSRNRMGSSVCSTFQKVQRIHELEFSYASFMISLRYRLCWLCTDYASTKKKYYVVLCFPVSFIPPQIRKRIRRIWWEVRFIQHFRRYREFMRLNFRMLLLCYRYVIVYADFTWIMLQQIIIQRRCVTLILCVYVYSLSDAVMVHSIYYASILLLYFHTDAYFQRNCYFVEFPQAYEYVILSL